MANPSVINPSRAQISTGALQRLHITMRHLFIRGYYKPLGVSGESMISALLDLEPEIYGSIADTEKVELNGLNYVFQRLPQGIEQCQYIKLISREGYEAAKGFTPIVPAKRRRDCYRIDEEHMYIEMTRGRSDVYDVLTHLTFMYIEAEKIRRHALDHHGRKRRRWLLLEEIIRKIEGKKKFNKEVGYTHLSTLLGRTYEEIAEAAALFDKTDKVNSLFSIVYWLGQLSINEYKDKNDREITFSATLREKLGMHIFGAIWAHNIKQQLEASQLLGKELHIVSANLHSIMNSLYATSALKTKKSFGKLMEQLSTNASQNKKVKAYALKNGMAEYQDTSGTNIDVQIFDLSQLKISDLPKELKSLTSKGKLEDKVLIVMDYAFGEQAYECMDELLKPYDLPDGSKLKLDIKSVNIMGKAGILKGKKGDIIVPTSHVFEGTADNYPFKNSLKAEDFADAGVDVYSGCMITVLGTSLQNKDILRYFLRSSWKAAGLEMEGAHYQKAIQSAALIRNSINKKVELRYAYYASDNPLETGSTLASGGLGVGGVRPTYAITLNILKGILSK